MEKPEQVIQTILLRLEKITADVVKTQGNTPDTEVLKMVLELTREQVKNENSGS